MVIFQKIKGGIIRLMAKESISYLYIKLLQKTKITV